MKKKQLSPDPEVCYGFFIPIFSGEAWVMDGTMEERKVAYEYFFKNCTMRINLNKKTCHKLQASIGRRQEWNVEQWCRG